MDKDLLKFLNSEKYYEMVGALAGSINEHIYNVFMESLEDYPKLSKRDFDSVYIKFTNDIARLI